MHYHAEVILPPKPVVGVEVAVEMVMEPFNENIEGEEDHGEPKWWDFYIIGGRWHGNKLRHSLGEDKIEAFYKELQEEKITFSSLYAGRDKVMPESQEGRVDEIWRKHFPGTTETCFLMEHGNDKYANTLDLNVCKLGDLPEDYSAARVLIGGQHMSDIEKGEGLLHLHCTYMVSQGVWNGVTHQDTSWKGSVTRAAKDWNAQLENYNPEFAKPNTTTDDWLSVTVDYHS